MKKVAFLGLGTMGFHMAGHLSKVHSDTIVFNRTKSKVDNWIARFSGKTVDSIAEAAEAELIFLCAGRDSDVEELISGPSGLLTQAKPNTLIIDHTTTSAKVAEKIAKECQSKQVRFADAPVSGGEQGAINGQLSIMVGCEERDYPEVVAATSPYCRSIAHMGPAGFGQKAKMVNQICIAGLLQGLAEGLNFASIAGLDTDKLLNVITKGAAGSWQMENRSGTMLANQYDHGFALDWMVKDLTICLDEAQRNQASLPVTALVTEFYKDLQSMGCGRNDTSALLKRLQHLRTKE